MSDILCSTTQHAEQLLLRPWTAEDAQAASSVHGRAGATRWWSPSAARVSDRTRVPAVPERWATGTDDERPPVGRWVIERRHDQRVVGSASLLPLPPGNDDVEIAWQLDGALSRAEHDRLGSMVVSTLTSWAFDNDVDEVFAVVTADDARTAAELGRRGLRWVGETTKYLGLDLQVYRLRRTDLLRYAPGVDLAPVG